MKLLVVLLALVVVALCKEQKVSVKGTVICDKRRMPKVTVQLWERDTLDPNDLLKEVETNGEGEFELSGSENEITKISPFVRIIHTCHVKKDGCKRTTEYEVPKQHIDGSVYDMTYVNLDIISAVDSEKC